MATTDVDIPKARRREFVCWSDHKTATGRDVKLCHLPHEMGEWSQDFLTHVPLIRSHETDEMSPTPQYGGIWRPVRIYQLGFADSVDAVLFSLRWL